MKTTALIAVCIAGVLGAGSAAAAELENAPRQLALHYSMTVDAAGKAASLTPLATLPADVDRWIRQRVYEYTFEPAKVNGIAQTATTTLYLSLSPASGADATTGYRINSLSTGPRLVKGRYETYPRTAGAGYFIMNYDASGKVVRAELDKTQASVGDVLFRRWGMALARSFRFEPETVAGMAVPSRAMIQIVTCIDDTCPVLPPPLPENGNNLDGELVAESVLKAVPPAGS